MVSSKIARIVCKNIFPSHFVNHRVLLLQSPNFTLRNARPDLLQSLPYANSSSSHHTSEESISYKFTKDTAKRLPTAILAKIIVAGLVGLLSLDLSFAWYWSRNNEHLILKTLEKGTKPEAAVANEELVKRPLVVEHLKRIFNPNKNVSNYYMICGEHGAGKTTLTKIASKEVGKGVIYFDVPENPTIEKFGMALGQVLNFTFEEHISFTAQLINKILGIIPGRKTKAGEMGKELKSVADDFIAGQSFEVIKQSILTKVKKKFDSANLLRNQSNHEAGKRLIKVLLDSKEIDTDLFREYFKDEKYNEVLEANVFAYHPSRDCITFQSRSIEYYIRENANIFIK
ncbi:ATPase family member [Gigaspora margarita]|uniref:ATPase family member n=1 Tax=Gigaspora margarita TaxID=4874 RepID=A0A8H3XDF5_GIGMA|nr:ATPase family member [Gigaspora margarita]